MRKDEYDCEKLKIENESKRKLEQLYLDYAISNMRYRKGNIISDGEHTIKIDDMNVRFPYCSSYPEIAYRGIRLKKNGEPKKDRWGNMTTDEIYQSDILESK
jgi:hypothetical protein